MSKKKSTSKDLVSNRRASHNYEILETFEAGLVLTGTEVKSLRANQGSLQEAYVKLSNNELWLVSCTIPPYKYGNIHNHQDLRERKLLMHKREVAQMKAATREKGLAIIPLGLYLSKGKIKLKIALAKGKKAVDKRHALKERDEKRRMDKAMKYHQ